MLDAIRSAMRSPLARPAGRQGVFAQLKPAWCAAAVYILLGLPVAAHTLAGQRTYEPQGRALLAGAVLAYIFAWLVLIAGPLVAGALAWSRERDRETLEALVLTPADRLALVRGRFWQGVWPWLRFCAYLLPVYLVLSTNDLFRDACVDNEAWIVSDICATGNPMLFGLIPPAWDSLFRGMNSPHPWTITLATLRWLNEASIPLVVFALAQFLSLRCRTTSRAVFWSCLLVPTTLFTLFDLQDWLLLLVIWDVVPVESPSGIGYTLICSAYLFLGIAAFIGRIWLALWLVNRAARNFDLYATGERPTT
ncbi:MAG TPA: hypothetical protein PK280_18810 [Planctomycetota bacterium]|nr:hypothetical protein [Planctomycetota bacterium]